MTAFIKLTCNGPFPDTECPDKAEFIASIQAVSSARDHARVMDGWTANNEFDFDRCGRCKRA